MSLGIATLAAASVAVLARRWDKALAVFGTELPAAASLSMALAPWLLVLPALIALAWAFSPRPGRGLAVGVGMFTVILAVVCITAMYIPLFKLAAVA